MSPEAILAQSVGGGGAEGGWGAWSWLVLPLASYALVSLTLFAFGRTDDSRPSSFVRSFFGRISDALRRSTGFPGWSMAGVLSGLLMLLVLVIGFYWDVAWHIDNGRDDQLFTVSHTMILVGLGGLVYAAVLTVLFATLDETPAGFGLGPLRVPWSAVVLGALGIGGVTAFPLDNLWHEAYGVDVTLWSPTHLQLVAGGSLATIALFLMCAEALPDARPKILGRLIFALTGGTVLVAMSTFQGEFDYGVPQFQLLFLPILIGIAAAFSLVLARVALGPWGAIKAWVAYLILRLFLAVSVGGALHHTVPRFPLYLGAALAVEAAALWVGTGRRLRFSLVAGALVGTGGLVAEMAFVTLSGWSLPRLPLDLALKIALLAPPAAVAAAVLGGGLARAFTGVKQAGGEAEDRIPVGVLVGAAAVLMGALAVPLPRNVGRVDAVIRTQMVGSDSAVVEVALDPPDAAREANAFAVTSWQGGGRVTALLEEVGPGRYRTDRALPVTGRWKTTVGLLRGDQVMAAPVYLPADPEIDAPEIPLVPERRTAFVRNTVLLLREAHDGPAWPALAAFSGLGVLVLLWAGLMAWTAVQTTRPPAATPSPRGPASVPPAPGEASYRSALSAG